MHAMVAAGEPVLVLYGSQTGNARMIAKELCDKAVEKGYAARCVGMEDWNKIEWEDEPNLVCVCSVTGNGDPPENAEKFYRFIKKRTSPQRFSKTRFTVCCLGDSNYEEVRCVTPA